MERKCKMKRLLVLENGEVFEGVGFGADCEGSGEVIFHTSMTGYQEIISDPSYCGQIITMTNPMIGACGINRDDFESIKPSFAGLIVKELASFVSHYRSKESLDDYLKKHHIPGIKGIDTRKLTRMIRKDGSLKGRICHHNVNVESIIQQLSTDNTATHFVPYVSTTNRYMNPGDKERLVLIDFGVKKGIVKQFVSLQYEVIVVPFNTTSDEIRSLMPDGIVLSNGPGDPRQLQGAINVVKDLLGEVPIIGISLGFEILALACGASVVKMKCGHHGSNYPVKDLQTGKVVMTTQNHEFTVDMDSIVNTELEITHQNVNDLTIEGIRHREKGAMGVQFYPDGAPGPHDMHHIFNEFSMLISRFRKEKNHAETDRY